MNSLSLLQLTCSSWLTAQDQSVLTMPELEQLLVAVNGATNRVWRKLPASYRRQTFSCAFEAAVTGTITATTGSRTASFSFTPDPFAGDPAHSEAREFCTLTGDTIRNEHRIGGLLHPWQGPNGTAGVTLYHDATITLGYLVERVLSPMIELTRNQTWSPAAAMESERLWNTSRRIYDFQRISFLEGDGDRRTRTLFRVAKLDGSARVFEAVVSVLPLPLSIVDAAVPSDLFVDDEIAEIISIAAGIELQTHPRWRGKDLSRATSALDRLRDLSPSPTSDPQPFGTPEGW